MFLARTEFMLFASCSSTVLANWIFALRICNQLPPLRRLQNSKPKVGQWPYCGILPKFSFDSLSFLTLCISTHCLGQYVLSNKTFGHLVILPYVFSPQRSDYPLSATVSGPFLSRLRQSGPRLRENVRRSWRKFVWTETSRLNKKLPGLVYSKNLIEVCHPKQIKLTIYSAFFLDFHS